jgi:ribosomal protein S18 acetylase RimI-like enzyme
MMNGVWVARPDSDPEVVGELLAEVVDAGLPYCLQLRSHSSAALCATAAAFGMSAHADMPLMALSDPDGIERALATRTIALRRLDAREAPLHGAVAAPAFGMQPELFARIAGPATFAMPGVTAYVGELDGTAVATALAVALEGSVGIFNVATAAEHRRQGYGGAVTALAVHDAFAEGAQTAWLQSSEMGRRVYESLGFALAESWKCWVSSAG